MYSVFYTSAASRQLKRLPQEVAAHIQCTVESLANNPRAAQTQKLEGYPNAYRLRIGRYRVVYTIEDPIRRVVIYRIGHRKEVYR